MHCTLYTVQYSVAVQFAGWGGVFSVGSSAINNTIAPITLHNPLSWPVLALSLNFWQLITFYRYNAVTRMALEEGMKREKNHGIK